MWLAIDHILVSEIPSAFNPKHFVPAERATFAGYSLGRATNFVNRELSASYKTT